MASSSRIALISQPVFSLTRRLAALLLLPLAFAATVRAQTVVPAFPGAVGFGAAATGGRGGTIVHVTNLNDSGTGSFRDAVSHSKRVIVFDVGGNITLSSAVSCSDNLTIAGQTAPGQGISIEGREVSFSNSTNCIVRYVRFRQGLADSDTGKSTLGADTADTLIFDHCSIEFGQWDNLDVNSSTNITFQNCIIADPTGQQFNAHCDSTNVTWYANLWSSAHNRNPLAKGNQQYINNVCYNFQAGFTEGNTSGNFKQDIVDNYFITGPSTSNASDAIYQVNGQSMYFTGNLEDSNRDGDLNGSAMGQPGSTVKLTSPWTSTTNAIPTRTAAAAYAYVVANAGALPRDEVDTQVIGDLMSLGTVGHLWTVNSQKADFSNNGYPILTGGTPLKNSNGDGIPDIWKNRYHLSLSASIANMDFDGTGYTNIEKYVNGLADGTYTASISVNLTGKYNGMGIVVDGTKGASGLDGLGDSSSAFYLNGGMATSGFLYSLGAPGASNVTRALGQTILLPSGNFASLALLGAATHGALASQKFTVRYTDGSVDTLTASLSDWKSPQGFSGETVALTMGYQNLSTGAIDYTPNYAYQYLLPLAGAKTVRSVTLPNNSGLALFGIDLLPAPSLVISSATYYLTPVNALAQNEALAVATPGTGAVIQTYASAANQKWTITSQGNGLYRLSPLSSPGSALDVVGASSSNASVDIAAWTGGTGQLWQIVDLGTGYYQLIPQCAQSTNKALDVFGKRTTDGTVVDTYTNAIATNQQWLFSLAP